MFYLTEDGGYTLTQDFLSSYKIVKHGPEFNDCQIIKEDNISRRNGYIYFINDSAGFFIGETYNGEYIVQRTGGYGTIWQMVFIYSQKLNAIYFPTSNIGYLVGNNGYIFKTINAGVHWDTISKPTIGNLISVNFINQDTGFIGGSNGLIMRTNDGGESWSKIDFNNTEDVIKIWCFNEEIAYVLDGSGGLYKNSIGTFAISDIPDNNSGKIYPNPVKEIIYVEGFNNFENVEIFITNLQGKVLLKTFKRKINVSNLNEGMYFIKILRKNQIIYRTKIIKI